MKSIATIKNISIYRVLIVFFSLFSTVLYAQQNKLESFCSPIIFKGNHMRRLHLSPLVPALAAFVAWGTTPVIMAADAPKDGSKAAIIAGIDSSTRRKTRPRAAPKKRM